MTYRKNYHEIIAQQFKPDYLAIDLILDELMKYFEWLFIFTQHETFIPYRHFSLQTHCALASLPGMR